MAHARFKFMVSFPKKGPWTMVPFLVSYTLLLADHSDELGVSNQASPTESEV